MDHIPINKLPILYSDRTNIYYSSFVNSIYFNKISYIHDKSSETIYYVIPGGLSPLFNSTGNMIKLKDKIIFNGTDEFGFDIASISQINTDSFQIEYEETNDSVLKFRNMKRLLTPNDFINTNNNYTIRLKKFNEIKENRWFLVIHSLTYEEYETEILGIDTSNLSGIDSYISDNSESYESDDDNYELEDSPLSILYHCNECNDESPLIRERCKILHNDALVRYSCQRAYNARYFLDTYAHQNIQLWKINIDNTKYYIDKNNVLFSSEGIAIGYAKSSNNFDNLFIPILFNEDNDKPPHYPNIP